MDIAFHVNPTQPHQREHAQWFKEAIPSLKITSKVSQRADIHIISGPHYAKDYWIHHPRVILIDRACIPDHQYRSGEWKSEDWISAGWMRPDGGRLFKPGTGRQPPTPKNRKSAGGTIFLADYDGPVESADTVRLHPARKKYSEPLLDALHRHARAVGYSTTALVAAGLEGLEIICKDRRNIMFEPNWLELLPYADWHYSEIDKLWSHLQL